MTRNLFLFVWDKTVYFKIILCAILATVTIKNKKSSIRLKCMEECLYEKKVGIIAVILNISNRSHKEHLLVFNVIHDKVIKWINELLNFGFAD